MDQQLEEFNALEMCSIIFCPMKEMPESMLYLTYYSKQTDILSPTVDYLKPLFDGKITFTKYIGRHYYPELKIALRRDALDKFTWDDIFYITKTLVFACSDKLELSGAPLPKIFNS
jgi:hypothetical protein